MAHQPTSPAHTPGPWILSESDSAASSFGIADANGSSIASVGDGRHDGAPEESAANARLIAAAPDLLDACMTLAEVASDSVELGDWPELIKAIEQADAAIAKADGTQTTHE
jgi:hypothetical protein